MQNRSTFDNFFILLSFCFNKFRYVWHTSKGVRDYIHIMDLAEGHWAATKKILRDKMAKGQTHFLHHMTR